MGWTPDAEAGLGGALALAAIERVDEDGRPWVRAGAGAPQRALALASVPRELLERAHREGDPAVVARIGDETVVLGVLATGLPPAEARVDGRKAVLTGSEEVTLRCGKASITLTKAGKILIRGTYVLTQAEGVNRIRGGSVQIN